MIILIWNFIKYLNFIIEWWKLDNNINNNMEMIYNKMSYNKMMFNMINLLNIENMLKI